jgi:hypothetical protein
MAFFVAHYSKMKGGGFTHWTVIVANIHYPSRSPSGNYVKALLISFPALTAPFRVERGQD